MAKVRTIKALRQALQQATLGAVNEAAEWLAQEARRLVDVQCAVPSAHHMTAGERAKHLGKVYAEMETLSFEERLMRYHSAPGSPPYKESGKGRESIGWAKRPWGAVVGVRAMPDVPNMIGQNYMAGWDSERGIRPKGKLGMQGVRRPWLSQLTKPSYQRIIAHIILLHLRAELGK